MRTDSIPSVESRANAARIQSSGCSGEDLSAVAVAMWCSMSAAERYRSASSASSYGIVTFYDRQCRGGNFRRVAEAREPVHAGFLAKPSELALGEAARGLLDSLHGVFFAGAPGKMFAQLRISDELERLGVGWNAARDERAHFFQPSGCEHCSSARVNARVESGARRQEADLDDFVALQRVAAAAMDFTHWFSGEQAQFDRANCFLHVGGGNARSGFRIQARKDAVQMRGAALFGHPAQARTNIFGALRGIGKP